MEVRGSKKKGLFRGGQGKKGGDVSAGMGFLEYFRSGAVWVHYSLLKIYCTI